ncbi:Uncharacterised protein [Mycobacteroides abscessus subsp. abscessus]|nr:Uncharacterised protein [Mycobacteroides abscessus subsp. abscessus]
MPAMVRLLPWEVRLPMFSHRMSMWRRYSAPKSWSAANQRRVMLSGFTSAAVTTEYTSRWRSSRESVIAASSRRTSADTFDISTTCSCWLTSAMAASPHRGQLPRCRGASPPALMSAHPHVGHRRQVWMFASPEPRSMASIRTARPWA